jgi:hypothetical protein
MISFSGFSDRSSPPAHDVLRQAARRVTQGAEDKDWKKSAF